MCVISSRLAFRITANHLCTLPGTDSTREGWNLPKVACLWKIYIKNTFFQKKKLWPWSLGKNNTWLSWKILNGQSKWFIRSTKVHSPLGEFYEFFSAKNTKTVITRWILRIKRNWRGKFNLNLTEIIIVTCSLI